MAVKAKPRERPAERTGADGKVGLRRLVQVTAARLRETILACEPGAQIGSLNELTRSLGVGVATLQQAARILEHEGLLRVRRGPGGGYFGIRPDEAALIRAMSAYFVLHPDAFGEALGMTTLLQCDLMPAAARCTDQAQFDRLAQLLPRIEASQTSSERIDIEDDLRQILLKMVERPLLQLMTGVTVEIGRVHPQPAIFADNTLAWKEARRRIIQGILSRDVDLVAFEARRYHDEFAKRLQKWRRRQMARVTGA